MDSDATLSVAGVKPTLAERVRELACDIRALVSQHLELAVAEFEGAAHRLVAMIAISVAISILLASAWLTAIVGGIVWAAASGASWPLALFIGAGTNLVLVAVLALIMRRQTEELRFPATRRQLRRSAGLPEPESSS